MKAGIVDQSFFELSTRLLNKQVTIKDLPMLADQLPPTDRGLMERLGREIEDRIDFAPQSALALALVMDSICSTGITDTFTKSLAAWHLGVVLNALGKPLEVEKAISRARQGFASLEDNGWLAACDWQFFALSWTKPNLGQAETALSNALTGLERAGMHSYVPHCRLALAYVQILLLKFEDAKQNIQASEQTFMRGWDGLNQARCWMMLANCLRREGRLDEALLNLKNALDLFRENQAPIDIAKAEMQIGLCQLIKSEDLSEAGRRLGNANRLFGEMQMDLWQDYSLQNLGYVHLLTGSLEEAYNCFQQARETYTKHHVLGLLGDSLNDTGKLNLLRGYPALSIEQFKQAIHIHDKIGFRLPAAIEGANLGEAYGYIGRYQDALHHLELAAEKFKSLNNMVRLGAVEKSMAFLWSQLNQPARALEHLEHAARHHEAANQRAMLPLIYNHKAGILFSLQQQDAAIECLITSLELAGEHGMKPQAAKAQRLLGEILLQAGQGDQALTYLEQARNEFLAMGMLQDLAANQVTIGKFHLQTGNFGDAHREFEGALQLSEGTFHEVDWLAHEGLSSLAILERDDELALQHYQKGMAAIARIRENFWQPALAGSYLERPARFVDKAILHTIRIRATDQALQFIENNKAATLIAQLLNARDATPDESIMELAKMKAEINWLQGKLREVSNSTNLLKNALQSHQYRAELIQKAKQYDARIAAEERKHYSTATPTVFRAFNHDIFYARAGAALGKKWVVLDYYLTDNRLNIIMITPEECQAYSLFVSERFSMALEALSKSRHGSILSDGELRFLGGLLIPSGLGPHLTPDTHLILSPHKKLHGIPWSALLPAFSAKPLIQLCIPVITPSLHALTLLWEQDGTSRGDGLLVGISDFHGTKNQLPHVKEEFAALKSHLKDQSVVLMENEATWDALMQLCDDGTANGKAGLSRFDWLHIASHFSVDTHTGRLSGLTLSDGDIWLDQLRDLAPIPGLAGDLFSPQ
jgi:tetratricopeptide (TPR) repeat protein